MEQILASTQVWPRVWSIWLRWVTTSAVSPIRQLAGEPLLRSLDVYRWFIVISGDSLPHKKPDPMPLRHAADFFQLNPHDALMLGDSISDVRAARAAGFQVICVSYGYNHGEDIRLAKPDAVIDSFVDLKAIL